jgi:diguanylate cyclase (GGDEF)-like protein/PAS domain S-box-containing protein
MKEENALLKPAGGDRRRGFHSLRLRLIVVAVLVELAMVGLLLANGVRLVDDSLINQTRDRNEELKPLLRAALAAPLAQRDYATLQEILTELRSAQGLPYLVLFDGLGRVAAAAGWDRSQPLPSVDADSALGRKEVFHARLPIVLAGVVHGELRYGISTRFLDDTRQRLVRDTFTIATLVIVLSVLLLILLSYWLTRHLGLLTRAAEEVAAGRFDLRLPVSGDDEVASLTRSFNRMAAAIENRIAALEESERRFHAIADYTYDWESWLGPDGRLLWVNPSVRRITGYTPEEVMAMPDYPLPLIAAEDRERVYAELTRAISGTSVDNYEMRINRKDGALVWCSAAWQPIHGPRGEYLGIRLGIRDISELKEAQFVLQEAIEELRQSEDIQRRLLEQARQEQARLASLLSAMNIGILFENADNRVIYVNAAFRRIWLIRDNVDLAGRRTTEVLDHSGNVLARPDHFSKHVLQVTATHEVSETFEIVMADGRVVTQISYPVRDEEGRFIGRLWIYEDVTRERQTAEQLIYLAERDSLTGLYNRRRFQEELARMMAEVDRRNSQGALLFFDLDEFKYVNDTFGHRAGDAMLIRVAGEVSALIRRNEIFSRLGGDEFAVLLPDAGEKEAAMLGERIVRAIAQIPFRFEGQNIRLTTSVGIALYPRHATSVEELIAHADAAMYQAKEAGKNAWRIYRADLDASRQRLSRLTWNERIANALDKGLLRLHFQGVYGARDGRLSHLEVLVRMVDEADPERLIMPGHFIPLAEASGRILDIDRWVIAESIKLLARLQGLPALAVNVSGRSFDDPFLPQFIADTLHRHGVAPHRLMVELTETAAVSDLHDAQRFIEALHLAGCRVCLDDFGSGFSSFAYLKHLKADILKIDGLFIRDLPNDYDNQMFVKAIVGVAQGMRKPVIAEFVEDEATLLMLREFGVDFVQGYHLDMPRGDHPALGEAA